VTTTTLNTLTPGDTATITTTAGASAALLRAMGLREGMDVTVKRTGAPCIVETGNTRLGLASVLSAAIEVAPHA